MTIHTAAGTIIKIAAAQPATFNATGYRTLAGTAQKIGEITDAGEFGREYNLISHNPIDTRGTKKAKGSFNEGAVTLQLAIDKDDEGQETAKAARDSDNDYSIIIETPDGHCYGMQVQVMSFKTAIGSVDNVIAGSINMEITTDNAGVGVVEFPKVAV